MKLNLKGSADRTIILALVCLPIIVYLLYFANKKNKESGPRMQACQLECEEAGYAGYEFKWGIVGAPQCECLNNLNL